MPAAGGPPKVLIAPDKFKGSLSAAKVAHHIAAGLRRRRPTLSIDCCPIADGGDGTMEAALSAGYARIPVEVDGPTGLPVRSAYAKRDRTCVIEIADASGLRRLPEGHMAPLTASSFGVGQLIRAALDSGVDRIILGLGGSACTDGGAGMISALGVRLLDGKGNPVPPGGAALRAIERIDISGLDRRLSDVVLIMATDVDNPLLGPTGAARVYGPQKGATGNDIVVMEDSLHHWARLLIDAVGFDASNLPGAGAAGGVGFGALSMFKAKFAPGVDVVMEFTNFHDHLLEASLVITGEGSLDSQSLHGKAPIGIARAAASRNIPVIAVTGRATLSHEEIRDAGIGAVYSLTELEPDLACSMKNAGPLLERLVDGILDDWLHDRP